jgi:prolyl-tRNA synthetase
MGSYGIGSGRLLACIAEEYNDEYGLIWPITVAPYHVHLVLLPGKASQKSEDYEDPLQISEALYKNLQSHGLDVLYDDREESPGVKFNDADLIGIPIRLTVSARSLENDGVEFKRRDLKEKTIIPLDDLIAKIDLELASLQAEIDKKVVDVPFNQ